MRCTVPLIPLIAVLAAEAIQGSEPALIPQPLAVTPVTGSPVALVEGLPVAVIGADAALADDLCARCAAELHVHLARAPSASDSGIVLRIDPALQASGAAWAAEEAYALTSGGRQITISARTPHGLFNGMQTLLQLIVRDTAGGFQVPALEVRDAPRFHWRGLMLDCGRHFFTVAEVCRFIDQMASYKFNTFHWHLTEDQGWRIEVPGYPKLTSVGAWRAESPRMGEAGKGDGVPYGGFYTQEDIRTVVQHASARFITVIPELEMQGHSSAAIASYPELGNFDIPGWTTPVVATRFGVNRHTLAPREETFHMIAAVFDAVLPLFPGAYVHIGGDESPITEWHASPFAQQVMQEHHLADEHQLQSWFIQRVEQLLTQRGKRLIGWDEIQEGGLSPTATMMVWRNWKWATAALAHGNDVVMSPTTHTYFDYSQGPHPDSPLFQTIGGNLPLEKVYTFEPIPEGTASERIMQVLGCQGQLWSEYIWSMPKLEYMAWPRACALAEVAWSAPAARAWPSFTQRLAGQAPLLERMGIDYRTNDGSPALPERSLALTPHAPASR